jgi:hypothetical protein
MEDVVHFMASWSILLPFGTVCGLLIYFAIYLVYFSGFGMLYQEKSGNPAVQQFHFRMDEKESGGQKQKSICESSPHPPLFPVFAITNTCVSKGGEVKERKWPCLWFSQADAIKAFLTCSEK